jgi:hypothetical protein
MPAVPYTPSFLAVKLLDIGLVTVYFFAIGLLFAKVFDYIYGPFKEENYKDRSTAILFGEIILHLFLLGVVAYVLRNIVQMIPFPLDGVAGFEHARLKELEGGHVISIVLLFFQENLQAKLAYFAKRAFGLVAGSE